MLRICLPKGKIIDIRERRLYDKSINQSSGEKDDNLILKGRKKKNGISCKKRQIEVIKINFSRKKKNPEKIRKGNNSTRKKKAKKLTIFTQQRQINK